jgi:hypothetical protein
MISASGFSTTPPSSPATAAPPFGGRTIPLSPKFGAEPPTGAPKPPGSWQTLKAGRDYLNHGANRDIVKAMSLKYAPDLLLPAALMLPLGWLIGIVGFIPALLISRHGEKKIDKLKESGRLHGTDGPLARVTSLNQLWESVGDPGKSAHEVANAPKTAMDEFNRLLADLFPNDSSKSAAVLRERLTLTTESKGFKWLNHIFNARQYYARHFLGRLCRPLTHVGSKIPFRPVQLLFVLPEVMTMSLVTLLNRGKIQAMAAKAL